MSTRPSQPTRRYKVVRAPETWGLAASYFGFDRTTERETTIIIVIQDGESIHELVCYVHYLRHQGLVDGQLLDHQRNEHYIEGFCRGIPFVGDDGNDYPVRAVISLTDRTGWLEFRPTTLETQPHP